jgi:hypothetical protein
MAKKETSNCVIRDDDHDWGGEVHPEPENVLPELVQGADTLLQQLKLKFPELHNDEPMNWPFR